MSLSDSVSPATIARLVIAIVIDSFYGIPLWTSAHISKKVFVGITPSFAHFYSTPSVTVIKFIFRVIAAGPNI